MKLLKAFENGKLNIKVILSFNKQFDASDFSLGLLELKRKDRTLYLDITYVRRFRETLHLSFEYNPDVLKEGVSKECDLKVEDLILGLDTCNLAVDFMGKELPYDQFVLVEADDTELKTYLTID